MKKILLVCVSSVFSVLGLSSFSNSRIYLVSYYWFYVVKTIPFSVTSPTYDQISGDYLGYSTLSNINNRPFCAGTVDLCLVGYTLGSISGFSAGGVPTGLQTISGIPEPYVTTGSTSRSF